MIIDITLADNKDITSSSDFIGKVSENKTTLLKFHVTDEIATYSFYLDFKLPNGTKFTTKKLDIVNNLVEYEITNSLLNEDGTLQVEVILVKGDIKTIFPKLWFKIEDSINATNELAPESKPLISEIEEVLDLIDRTGSGNKFLSDDGTYKELPNEITSLTGTADDPIVLRNLEAGIYSFDGKVVPFNGGSATTYSYSLAMVQKTTSYTYVQVFYTQSNNVQFFKINNNSDVFEKETTSFSKLEEKTTIAKNTNSTTVTTQLSNNLFYQCKNELTVLTLLFPSNIEDDYKSRITFKTGKTAPTFTCKYDVIWHGDDVSNNIFVPKASKYYYLEFYKDVDGIHGYARPNYIEEIVESLKNGKADKTALNDYAKTTDIEAKNFETANNKVSFVNKDSTDTQYPSAKCTYEIKDNLDRLKNNVLEVGEASDTYIHVEDSSLNELKELEVEGVCEQQTTTGKNLLPNKIQTNTIHGVTCTNNGDGTITLNGTTTAKTYLTPSSKDFISLSLDGNYTFSANTYNNLGYSLYHGGAELFFWDTKSDKTFSATGSFDNVRPQINIESGVTLNNVIVKFQLEKGSTATEYEPYTEGQATPSPDYPQEIKTITDSLKLTSCNKNLCNGVSQGLWISSTDFSYGKSTTDSGLCIPVDGISSYTISSNITQEQYRVGFTTQNPLIVTSGSCYKHSVADGTNSTITISSVGYKYLIVNATDLSSIQIEKKDSATSFEQHLQSQITANLPEGEFIGKIDDTYKDTLKVVYKEDGKHHLVLNKKLKKTIFVGADDENWTHPTNKTEFFQIVMADMRMLQDAYTKATLLSNFLIPTTPNILWLTNINGITNLNGTRHIRVRFKDNPFTTITDFKTWLSTHNLEVYYVLESPYEVDLGIVDMPLSYSGVTNIFTDSDLLPKINDKYYKSITKTIQNLQQELIDIKNRLSALEAAKTSEVVEESKLEN